MSENTEAKDLLVHIDQLKTTLKDKDERIMSKIHVYLCVVLILFNDIFMIATETELATFKELSKNRLEKLEALQIHLQESQCINGMTFNIY